MCQGKTCINTMKEHENVTIICTGGIWRRNSKMTDIEVISELAEIGYRAFEAASVLGAPYMVMHPGMESPEMTKEVFFRKFKAFIDKLLSEVGYLGIKIALENLAPFDFNYRYVQTGSDLRELIEYIDHPLVGACWDTGHGNLCRADQYESITALGEHLLCLHTSGNVGQFELGFKAWRMDLHAAPLMGVSGVNFDAVLQALIDIDYNGTFNLEIEDPRPVWKKEFIYNGEKQNKLYYATDEMRKISRTASHQIASLMLKAYGLDA